MTNITGNYLQTFLDEKILNQGIKQSNFFNGRILNAQDLQDEQLASVSRLQQIRQAIGDGVVNGLEVALATDGADGNPPVLHISPGLAFNRCGQAVALQLDVNLTLTGYSQPPPADAGLFKTCQSGITSQSITGRNIYILVASPVSGYNEKAPQRGFNSGTVTGCGDRYAVEGVQFHTLELQVNSLPRLSQATLTALADLMSKDDAASLSKLRNWLAHVCFGTEERAAFFSDPFQTASDTSASLSYGAIDALRAANTLTDCDVPLALLYWTPGGVKFVDMWAVRRGLAKRTTDLWSSLLDNRRVSEGKAMLMQFEDQVKVMRNDPSNNAGAIAATDYFQYLPPVGIVPVLSDNFDKGFQEYLFFNGILHYPIIDIEGARLEALIHTGLYYPPQVLNSGVMLWIYRIRENVQAGEAAGQNTVQPYLVFSTGHMPAIGVLWKNPQKCSF